MTTAETGYRYRLRRVWDPELPPWLFIGLNPSTALEQVGGGDDPTSRKCTGFTQRGGGGSYWLGNLYPRRATKPAVLFAMPELERNGTGNDDILQTLAATVTTSGGRIVAAWGAHPKALRRGVEVRVLLAGYDLWCLGRTKDGYPRHPLYVPYAQAPMRFN